MNPLTMFLSRLVLVAPFVYLVLISQYKWAAIYGFVVVVFLLNSAIEFSANYREALKKEDK